MRSDASRRCMQAIAAIRWTAEVRSAAQDSCAKRLSAERTRCRTRLCNAPEAGCHVGPNGWPPLGRTVLALCQPNRSLDTPLPKVGQGALAALGGCVVSKRVPAAREEIRSGAWRAKWARATGPLLDD